MTKAEIIEKMAKDAGITKAAAGAALDSFISAVTKSLKKKDGKVTLVGFGTFSKVSRKARKGRNPQTGESIKIKAKNVVKFKAGRGLSSLAVSGGGSMGGKAAKAHKAPKKKGGQGDPGPKFRSIKKP